MIPTVDQLKRCLARNRQLAADSIGRDMTVRLRKATPTQSGHTVSGTIARCEYAGPRRAGGSIVAQFAVTLRCPGGSLHGPHVVEELPR